MAKKTTDPCQSERVKVANSEEKLRELEERLPEAPAAEKPRLLAKIKAEQVKLRGLSRQLDACVAAH
jgi:hypothetical protein